MSGVSRIVVDPDNGVPPRRQVQDQIVGLIRVGELPVGSQLPPIRQLARDLGLSAGTVARVYHDLETAGVLRTARRLGTVVAAAPEPETVASTALADAATRYITRATALGVDRHDAIKAILDGYRDLPDKSTVDDATAVPVTD